MKRWTISCRPQHISSAPFLFSLTLTLSPSHAHSKCLTGSLRKASLLLFPWQLACIGIDDISWSPTYFALKKRSPMNFANAISLTEGWRHFSHSRGETEKRKRLSVWQTWQTFLFRLSSLNLVGARHYSKRAQWPVLSMMWKENGFKEWDRSIFPTLKN